MNETDKKKYTQLYKQLPADSINGVEADVLNWVSRHKGHTNKTDREALKDLYAEDKNLNFIPLGHWDYCSKFIDIHGLTLGERVWLTKWIIFEYLKA